MLFFLSYRGKEGKVMFFKLGENVCYNPEFFRLAKETKYKPQCLYCPIKDLGWFLKAEGHIGKVFVIRNIVVRDDNHIEVSFENKSDKISETFGVMRSGQFGHWEDGPVLLIAPNECIGKSLETDKLCPKGCGVEGIWVNLGQRCPKCGEVY